MCARTIAISVTVLCGIFAPTTSDSQVDERMQPSVQSARQTLLVFERGARTGSASLALMMRHPEKYPQPRLDSIIEGLESLALKSKSSEVRIAAANSLSAAGTVSNPNTTIIARQIKVFTLSQDELARRIILGRMSMQTDRVSAISFLKAIASKEAAHQDYEGASLEAVSTLSYMGSIGRTALSDLRARRLVKESSAKGFIEWYFSKK